jgi:hypothetical protein
MVNALHQSGSSCGGSAVCLTEALGRLFERCRLTAANVEAEKPAPIQNCALCKLKRDHTNRKHDKLNVITWVQRNIFSNCGFHSEARTFA